jgi:rhodanese-related sulfurtransferase
MSLKPKQHSEAFETLVKEAKKNVRAISIDEYKALVAAGEAGLLIDVREESEFAAGHAVGAIHLGRGIIERDIEHHVADRAQRLVLYCGGGYRSVLAAESIQKMGYTNAISLDGGWRIWNEAGMPVEK